MSILLGGGKGPFEKTPQLDRYGTVQISVLKVVNLRLTPDSRAESPSTDPLEALERMGCYARWETGVLYG
jgi:hypothetical protein